MQESCADAWHIAQRTWIGLCAQCSPSAWEAPAARGEGKLCFSHARDLVNLCKRCGMDLR